MISEFVFMHREGVKHSIPITFSITINKHNQKWIHFLRKNLGMVNKEINRKYLDIYLPNAVKIQIKSAFEAFSIKKYVPQPRDQWKLSDHSMCFCLLTSWALYNFKVNIAKKMRGVFFRGLACSSSHYLSLILIINVTTAMTWKINFLSWGPSSTVLSKIKVDEGKSCYVATFLTKDLNSNLIKHNQNEDMMGTAKNNCCVVARSF